MTIHFATPMNVLEADDMFSHNADCEQLPTDQRMAEVVSKILGRPVAYEDITWTRVHPIYDDRVFPDENNPEAEEIGRGIVGDDVVVFTCFC